MKLNFTNELLNSIEMNDRFIRYNRGAKSLLSFRHRVTFFSLLNNGKRIGVLVSKTAFDTGGEIWFAHIEHNMSGLCIENNIEFNSMEELNSYIDKIGYLSEKEFFDSEEYGIDLSLDSDHIDAIVCLVKTGYTLLLSEDDTTSDDYESRIWGDPDSEILRSSNENEIRQFFSKPRRCEYPRIFLFKNGEIRGGFHFELGEPSKTSLKFNNFTN